QLVSLEHCPATARQRSAVSAIATFPREFHRRLSFPMGRAAVDMPLDVAELERAAVPVVELDERRDLLVDVVLVPFAHRDNVPSPRNGDLGFDFFFAIVS